MMRVWGLVCALALASCVGSDSLQCGDLTCPADYVCMGGTRCVSQEQIDACGTKADGDTCTISGASGVCQDGACATVVCGNGRVDPGEVCDDGNLDPNDGCNPTCRSDETCGNGFVDPGEGCDCGDGAAGHDNTACTEPNSEDATAACRTDCTPHNCGDGVVENSEQCEPGGAMAVTCADLGYYVGTPTCNSVCRATATGCSGSCGDGMVDLDHEELCDGAPPSGESCLDYGYDRGVLGCSQALCRPAFSECANLGWVEYAQDSRTFISIHGSSDSNVYAGGPAGTVFHWDGTTWSDASIEGPTSSTTAMWVVGTDDVFAATDIVIWHRNANGWNSVHTAQASAKAIAAFGTRVIAVGDNGMAATTNGAGWTDVTTGVNVPLRSIAMISATDAYVGGGSRNAVLLHWTGGVTWAPVAIPDVGGINAVWARNANDIYVGGDSLIHWDGATWSAISLGIDAAVTAISGTATDVFVAYALADGTIAQFDGTAWAIHEVRSSQANTAIYAAPGGRAFAAGLRLTRYVGSGFTTSKIAAVVALRAVGGAPGGPVFAVGDRGFAMKYDGTFWRRIPSELTANPTAISRNVVVGAAGAMGVFDGTRINAIATNVTDGLLGVWTAANGEIWAVGERGTIVHCTGGTCAPQTATSSKQLNAVFGFSTTNIYAVGEGGAFMHYNGATWSDAVGPAANATFNGIWAASATDMIVVGNNGISWHYTGSWTTLSPSASFGDFKSVVGIGADTDNLFGVQAPGTVVAAKLVSNIGWGFESGPVDAIAVGTDGTTIFAVGSNLGLYRRDATNGWTLEIPSFLDGGAFASVYAAAPDDIWAAAPSRPTAHFDGYGWSSVTTSLAADGVTGNGPSNVWLFNRKGNAAIRWNGSSFASVNPGIAGVNAASVTTGAVYVAGDDGALGHYTGSWTNDTSGNINVDLYDVFGLDANTAYTVGIFGSVAEWNGSTWTSIGTGTVTATLEAVWASSASDVFVGGSGQIGLRHNGTWTAFDIQGRKFVSMWGTGPSDVFAGGPSGTLYHFDGTTWSPINTNGFTLFQDASGVGNTVYFAIPGAGGSIRGLRRDVAW